ncbi:hypothetical protein ON010_g6538 [Phytophthora cinnamomi]|nr:hypothetical protein ON010_g6538 [Phytophthora cinnamomi]
MGDSVTTTKLFQSRARGDASPTTLFNRSHSLEIPGEDEVSGTDSDMDFQETQDFLDTVATEELWDSMLEPLELPETHNIGLQIPVATDLNAECCSTSQLSVGNPARLGKRVTNKQKISRLHKEIETLTSRLRYLQTSSKKPKTTGQFPTQRHQLWHQIAVRQLELRRQAEDENDKLREVMKMQVQEARHLRRILKRRTRIEMLQEMFGMKRQKKNHSGLSTSALCFEKMLHNVDELYAQADVMFRENGMHEIPCPGRARRTDSTTLNGVCYKLLERKLVPFSTSSAAEAVWHALGQQEPQDLPSVGRGYTMGDRSPYSGSGNDRNMLSSSFFAALKRNNHVDGLHVAKTVRRYVEDTRTVFVYCTTMEPKLVGVTGPAGLHLMSTLLVELRDGSGADSGEPMTLIQILFSAERHDDGLAAAERLRLPANKVATLTVCDETIAHIHHQIERFLVDAMLPALKQ